MALEEGAVSLKTLSTAAERQRHRTPSPIRCWKTTGHGSQTLTQAAQQSAAAFVNIGLRVGAEPFTITARPSASCASADDGREPHGQDGDRPVGRERSIWWSKNTFCSPKENLSQLAAASFGQTSRLPFRS